MLKNQQKGEERKKKVKKKMLNQVVLVGRLNKDLIIEENEKKEKVIILTLAVPRSYKNENGEYEMDFIDCILWNGIAEQTAEYCKKGDVVGIRGRLQSNNGELQLVADKVTFLDHKKKEDDDLSD